MTTPRTAAGRAQELALFVRGARVHHDGQRHSPTNRVGYCAEDDGISATFCDEGALLEAFAEARTALLADIRERVEIVEPDHASFAEEDDFDIGFGRGIDAVLAILDELSA